MEPWTDVEPETLRHVLLTVVTFLLSVAVHEFAHAWAAYRLGDDFAAREGRLTLNPLAHADPLGTLILPAFAALLGWGSFGWGKPVPYLPGNLTRKYSMRAGEAMIAFAGPLANVILALICGAIWHVLIRGGWMSFDSPFRYLLNNLIYVNIVLFLFNLIPVPPLDGSKVAAWIFGQKADKALDQIQDMGAASLMIAMAIGGLLVAPVAMSISFAILTFSLI